MKTSITAIGDISYVCDFQVISGPCNDRCNSMIYSHLADMVVLIHGLFVLFVLFGGLATLCWHRLAWFHIPAAVWGIMIELGGWTCPLTYLENHLRQLGGGSGYGVTFIEHYLEPLLYPLGLTRTAQLIFGLSALLLNLAIYARLWIRRP